MTVRVAQISDTHLSPSKPFFQAISSASSPIFTRIGLILSSTPATCRSMAPISTRTWRTPRRAHAALTIETHVLPAITMWATISMSRVGSR